MTDQNQAFPAQGSDANPQEEQHVNNHNQTMESLLKDQDLNVDLPQPGEIRTGMIASISPSQILVSIGAKSEGVVSGRELDQLTAEEREELKVGQEVHVFVINPEDENGNVVLSLKRAQEQISWENVEKLVAGDTVIDSKVIGFNKGGLIVGVEG
ncbi:MAG TPA: S1 RNA-binding domain-containing protein, partial [Anaerolineales bacterium]|nr:S1 RNA-binding domain-containing protein [Anaerolineales bacterium]